LIGQVAVLSCLISKPLVGIIGRMIHMKQYDKMEVFCILLI